MPTTNIIDQLLQHKTDVLTNIQATQGEAAKDFVEESCSMFAMFNALKAAYVMQEKEFFQDATSKLMALTTMLLADKHDIAADKVVEYLEVSRHFVDNVSDMLGTALEGESNDSPLH